MPRLFRFTKPRLSVIIIMLLWFVAFNAFLLWFRPESKTDLLLNSALKKTRIVLPPTTSKMKSLMPTTKPKLVNLKFEEVINLNLDYKSEFESQFDIVSSVSSLPTGSNTDYVLVIPREINTDSTPFFNTKDKQSVIMAGRMLDKLKSLDGIACLPRTMSNKKSSHPILFNQTWCNFARRDWSIQIRNSGKMRKLELRSANDLGVNNSQYTTFQLCNIINGPFVIRKEKFMELKGLRSDIGRLSLLDFFLRSNGKLMIGKFSNCFFSDDLFYIDRGNLEGSDDFPDYSNFGEKHNILRIIMEDRIEWTKCVATSKHCKEQPYVLPTTLPQIGQPICCSVLLAKMLHDIVAVFTKLNIDYRLIYGTLLGAERSGTIIPYTSDIDLAVDYNISRNKARYDQLQKYFSDKYYISSHSFMGMPRMIPLIPVYLNIKTSKFFDGEFDTQGNKFFTSDIVESIEGLLPFQRTNWRARGYADFYPGFDVWWNDSSSTFIDGEEYRTVREKHYELKTWYGKDWKTPIVKDYNSQTDVGAADG